MSNPLDPADAEMALIYCAFHQPAWLDVLKVTEADFYQPTRGMLWDRLLELRKSGTAADPVTVGPKHQTLLLEVVTLQHVMPSNAEHYATEVTDRAERRRLLAVTDGLRQRLNDTSLPLDEVMAETERRLARGGDMDAAASKLETLDEFLDRDRPDKNWVIPGLLTTGDRVVLTGIEGFGKSVAMRQIGVMTAAGLHPFTLRSIVPQQVLLVDCENPEEIMADVLGGLRTVARRRGTATGSNFWLTRYPQGLDLSKAKDRLELHRLCMMVRPGLLLIGPAYKLYVGGGNQREEDLARQVTSALDGLREEFGFALILEHHSPHGQPGTDKRTVRPIGSSLWLRWPEFGVGLAPQDGTTIDQRKAELRHWRGARADRDWPARLESTGPGELPWADPASLYGRH